MKELKKDENINALDEIHKGCCMGMDATNFVIDKIEDESFKKLVENLHVYYQNLAEEIEDVYQKYNSEDEPHDTNMMNKTMTWYGIEMKTLTDKSNSKISEMLLQGVNMGIIEGRKILNNKKFDKEVAKIVKNYVEMQESAVEDLKNYL